MSQLLMDVDAQLNSVRPSPIVGLKFTFKTKNCIVVKRLEKAFEYSVENETTINGENIITYNYWNAWFGKKIKLVN